MNAHGNSDGFVVPSNRTNNACAEPARGRKPRKGNAGQADSARAQKRNRGRTYRLAGVRETAWDRANVLNMKPSGVRQAIAAIEADKGRVRIFEDGLAPEAPFVFNLVDAPAWGHAARLASSG